jgi:AcrR family transcriptional regulator
VYTEVVPSRWTQTIDTHRNDVRNAIMDTTAALVAEQGLLSVTMSEIAKKTGIGRATLYKYFPEVEAILFAWHDRHITGHLQHLIEVRDHADGPDERLKAVFEAYALHAHESRRHHDTELAALVHRGQHVARVEQQLNDFIRDLLAEAAKVSHIRDDVASAELASYCLHALSAARSLPSTAAVERLVEITLAGLQHPRRPRR